MNFYTNVIEYKNKLLIRGVADGKPYLSRINYQPTLYTPTKEQSIYQTLDGTFLKPKLFHSIGKAKQFKETYKTMPQFKIYGMDRFPYQYIADEYGQGVEWDKNQIKIFTIDIECEAEQGFPDVDTANETIICITVKNHSNKQLITWGTGEFVTKQTNLTYIKCKD